MLSKLTIDSALKDLTLHQVGLDVNQAGGELVQLFEAEPLLPGIILHQNGHFVGILSRRQCFEHLSRPYGLELFLERPIRVLHNIVAKDYFVLPKNTPIKIATHRALQRPSKSLYEPILVEQDNDQFYLLDVNHLFVAHSHIHQLALNALEKSKKDLLAEKDLAQVTLHSIGDGVITTDIMGKVTALNPVAERLTGISESAAIGKDLEEVFRIYDEADRSPIPSSVPALLSHNISRSLRGKISTLLISPKDSEALIDYSINQIRINQTTIMGCVLVFRDITQERTLTRQLTHQSEYDKLTGLMNRSKFMHCLQQITASKEVESNPHILLFIDLDRFKIVNDTCGHLAGDELLKQASAILKQHVAQHDYIARLGSDEFVILLRQSSLAAGRQFAHQLRQAFQEYRFLWGEQVFTIGTSIGITEVNSRNDNFTVALSQADTACYWAKRQGHNRIQIFEPEQNTLFQDQRTPWINQVIRALEEDRFILYFQSIVPVSNNEKGHTLPEGHYEVLLRMRDENDQIVSPGIFLPAAERYNLMPTIDRWVIEHLFATQGDHYRSIWQQYQQKGVPCNCVYTVNLSGDSINEEGIVDFIQSQLERYDVPAEMICFEITETVAISNLSKAIDVIQALKKIGCKFALDDFGSGMSSFGYLKTLPVDFLKIDGSFIKDIDHDPIAYAMVDSINNIGQLMGLQTIAEWVDSASSLKRLQDLGVNYAQGYFLAKPKPFQAPQSHAEDQSSIDINIDIDIEDKNTQVAELVRKIKSTLPDQENIDFKFSDYVPA